MGGKNILSTWIVLDNEDSQSYFPQAGRKSSADLSVQALYWQCVVALFAVAKRASGPGQSFRLYTNDAVNMSKAPAGIAQMLDSLGVDIRVVPLVHIPPPFYHGSWRNQFYILDIMASIAEEDIDGNYLVLDSDCVCIRPLQSIFDAIEHNGALPLITGEQLGRPVNGLTREQMGTLFEELSNTKLAIPPQYYGGEFFAANSATIRRMLPLAEYAWTQSIERHHTGKLKFNEEAHLLSYVYQQLGLESGSANLFIKRLWTGVLYRNGEPKDKELLIVHLPGEKRFGYSKLYKAIRNPASWVYCENDDELRRIIQKVMSIPKPSADRLAEELWGFAINRILRLFSARKTTTESGPPLAVAGPPGAPLSK